METLTFQQLQDLVTKRAEEKKAAEAAERTRALTQEEKDLLKAYGG